MADDDPHDASEGSSNGSIKAPESNVLAESRTNARKKKVNSALHFN